MTDINAVVKEALGVMFESGKVKEMVEAQLDKTIKEIIGATLREYSDFGKALKAAIEAQIPTEFNDLRLAEYNTFVLEAVQRRLSHSFHAEWQADIERMLNEMFKPVGNEIKLSALGKMIRDEFKEERGCSCGGPESFTFHYEPSEHGGGWVYFDQAERKDKYRCAYMIALSSDGRVYSIKIDDVEPKQRIFKGPAYGMERLLMALYFGKTKLVIDCDGDDINTNLSDYD